MLEIKDSTAVITGGGGGIGLALAQYWVGNGGKVLIADVSEKLLDAAKTRLQEWSGNVRTILCDVTSENDCSKMADFAIEEFGAINLLAPFAGIIKDALMVSPDAATGKVTRKMTLDQFQSVININLTQIMRSFA